MHSSLDNLLNVFLPKDLITERFPYIQPEIPLPVQLPQAISADTFKMNDLTPEMILSGLLVIFAYDRENPNIEYYRKIFNLLRPNLRKEMVDIVVVKTKNGDYDDAEEILLAFEGLNPNDMLIKLNLALLMEERADFCESADLFEEAGLYNDKAEKLYESLILFEPPIPVAFFNAGYFFAKKKQYAKVKSLLSTYLKIETGNSDVIKLRMEKAESFVNLISSQLLDDKLIVDVYNLINENKPEDAANKLKDFLHKNPKAFNGWFLLGWALRIQKKWEAAKSAFLQSLSLLKQTKEQGSSSFANLYNELAICEMELNYFVQAENYLLEALAYEPENIKIISNLGLLALKQDKKEEAAGFFRTVLVINSNDKLAKKMLSSI